MNCSGNYVKELELLILETLLPVYEKYQKVGLPLDKVPTQLLKQIKRKKTLPALFRP
jgi:hypothetical protein